MTKEATARLKGWLERFSVAGERYAYAAAEVPKLERQRKIVLAVAMQAAEASGITSVAGQDRDARASPEYQAHCAKQDAADLEYELAKSALEALRLAASLSQTIQANERAELRTLGGTT